MKNERIILSIAKFESTNQPLTNTEYSTLYHK